MIFLGIFVAFVIFSVVVLIHEYGHFKSARFFGVKVEEFGLGIPPRAKKLWTDEKGTLFSLNWLPLGGFVKIAGESPVGFILYSGKGKKLTQGEIEKCIKKGKDLYDRSGKKISGKEKKLIEERLKENFAPYNLSQKPAWQQSTIILAGVFMNFVLASFIFAGLFLFGVQPIGINSTIPIETELKLIPTLDQAIESGIIEKHAGVTLYPLTGSLSQQSGIQDGDILLRINNTSFSEIQDVQEIISANANTPLLFYLERNNLCPELPDDIPSECAVREFLEIPVTPSSEGKIGSYLSENLHINSDFTYKYGVLESVKYGILETYGHAKLTFKALGLLGRKIFFPIEPTDRAEAVDQLSGPIGIVDFISKSITGGIVFLIIIGAIISVNLGVFNLLPIPALDGGRFVFIIAGAAYTKVTGKKGIPPHVEGTIHVIFFMILIGLSILIAYNDIVKIINN